jgi:hypothetical protein
VKLRSPFNGEVLTVSPDWEPAFVDELVKRGFTRIEDGSSKSKKRPEELNHG